MNTAIIYKLLSMVLALCCAFASCIVAGLMMGEKLGDPSLEAFEITILLSLGLSAIFWILGREGETKLFRREAMCAIGFLDFGDTCRSLPYALIVEDCDLSTHSRFIRPHHDRSHGFRKFYEFPASLLFWRSLSQWVGGLGVVVFFVAVLSSLGAGAKILFTNESSATSADFEQGRVQQGAFALMIYYLGLARLHARL